MSAGMCLEGSWESYRLPTLRIGFNSTGNGLNRWDCSRFGVYDSSHSDNLDSISLNNDITLAIGNDSEDPSGIDIFIFSSQLSG